MDKINTNISYSDYLNDPLDPRRSNVEYIKNCNDGFVILKSTKDIQAYSEILCSFGKKF